MNIFIKFYTEKNTLRIKINNTVNAIINAMYKNKIIIIYTQEKYMRIISFYIRNLEK